MKRIVLVLNGKGGVGKSFFAVNLVQYLVDKSVPHVAHDTDNENSTLARFHPKVRFLDLAVPKQLDAIFNSLQEAPLVVADCRAASTDLFLTFFEAINLKTVLSELDTALTLVIPINHEADSVAQVERLAGRMGNTCRYLIVRNASHSDSFALYEDLVFRAHLTGELGAREIDMPRLQDWLVAEMNRLNVTVTAAAKHPEFTLLDRQRLLNWQHRLYAAIESAQELLLPGKEGGAHA